MPDFFRKICLFALLVGPFQSVDGIVTSVFSQQIPRPVPQHPNTGIENVPVVAVPFRHGRPDAETRTVPSQPSDVSGTARHRERDSRSSRSVMQGMKNIAAGFGYDPGEYATPYSGWIDETLRRSDAVPPNVGNRVSPVAGEIPVPIRDSDFRTRSATTSSTLTFSQEPEHVRSVPVGQSDFHMRRKDAFATVPPPQKLPNPGRRFPIQTMGYRGEATNDAENIPENDGMFAGTPDEESAEHEPSEQSLSEDDPAFSPQEFSEEFADGRPADNGFAGEEDSILNKKLGRESEKGQGSGGVLSRSSSQVMPIISVVGTLSLVLGAFFLFVVFLRKVGPKTGGALPREALENIGRHPLNPKLQLNLIRLGNRLILIAVTPDGSVETIAEVSHPDEVTQILGMCRKSDPNSATTQFRSVLDEFAREKNREGFFGTNDSETNRGTPKRKSQQSQQTQQSLSSLLSGGLAGPNRSREVYHG